MQGVTFSCARLAARAPLRKAGARRLWISVIIPYAINFVLGLALLLQGVLIALLEGVSDTQLGALAEHLTAAELSTAMISLFGFF